MPQHSDVQICNVVKYKGGILQEIFSAPGSLAKLCCMMLQGMYWFKEPNLCMPSCTKSHRRMVYMTVECLFSLVYDANDMFVAHIFMLHRCNAFNYTNSI